MPYTQIENVAPGDKVRVDFDDGNWWEVLVEQPYGVSRQVRKLTSPVVAIDDNGEERMRPLSEFSGSELGEIADSIRALRLLRCSVAWSWDEAISEESIDRRRTSHVHAVVTKMDQLYGARAEETARAEAPLGNGSSGSS